MLEGEEKPPAAAPADGADTLEPAEMTQEEQSGLEADFIADVRTRVISNVVGDAEGTDYAKIPLPRRQQLYREGVAARQKR